MSKWYRSMRWMVIFDREMFTEIRVRTRVLTECISFFKYNNNEYNNSEIK